MKILVTGATGFIGTHLCRLLEEKGHKVFALVRDKEKFGALKLKVTMVLGSIDYKSEHLWLSDLPSDLDVIIHTAGITHSFDKKKFYDINAKATEKFIEDLKIRFKKIKFVLVSSLAVSGPSKIGRELTEDCIPAPVSHYGHSKYLSELSLLQKAPHEWIKVIIRPPMVLGPLDPAGVDLFKMSQSGFMVIAGLKGAKKEYSFICVHDLVDVIYKSFTTHGLDHVEIFQPSFPQIVTYHDIIEALKKVTKQNKLHVVALPIFVLRIVALILSMIHFVIPKFSFRLTPDKVNDFKPEAWTCSAEKTQVALQKSYDWDLEKTLKITFNDYVERGLL